MASQKLILYPVPEVNLWDFREVGFVGGGQLDVSTGLQNVNDLHWCIAERSQIGDLWLFSPSEMVFIINLSSEKNIFLFCFEA